MGSPCSTKQTVQHVVTARLTRQVARKDHAPCSLSQGHAAYHRAMQLVTRPCSSSRNGKGLHAWMRFQLKGTSAHSPGWAQLPCSRPCALSWRAALPGRWARRPCARREQSAEPSERTSKFRVCKPRCEERVTGSAESASAACLCAWAGTDQVWRPRVQQSNCCARFLQGDLCDKEVTSRLASQAGARTGQRSAE
jgi:hypothetical protein